MRTVERWLEFSLAYGLAIIGSATASICSFWSAAGPYDIVKGVGLFLIVFVGCHGLAWTRKASQRAGPLGGLFGASAIVICFSLTLYGGLGANVPGDATPRAESKVSQSTAARLTAKSAGMPFDATTKRAAVAVTLSNRELTLYAFGASLIFEVMAMFAMLIAFGESQPPEAVMKTHRVRVEEALALRERFHTKDLIARTVDQ